MLARPDWAGSGVVPESWWRNAVFYRVDPSRFQATGDSPTGDLTGLAQRLEYLQTLGVDALVLDGPLPPEGLDDLIREASRQHLRLLLTVTPAMQRGDRQALLQTVHAWLSAGAAGIWLPKADAGGGSTVPGTASLLSPLNSLLRSFPGERVLLTDPFPPVYGAASGAISATTAGVDRAGPRRGSGVFRELHGVQISTVAELPVQPASAAALRQSLAAVAAGSARATPGLLRFAEDPATGSADAVGAAAALLASGGAAMFDFGDEIGLRTSAGQQAATPEALPVMQWTPLNVQQAAAPIARAPPGVTKPGETPFGAYRPYVRPPPGSLTGAPPTSPRVAVDGDIPLPPPDPNTLPGFTGGTLPNAPVHGERINVATEDRDPHSLLNAYRQLIALHHGNATLRNGTLAVVNRDAQHAVVWVRRAAAGSRGPDHMLVAVNLGTEAVTLSLNGDLAALGMRSGALRPLFTWSREPLTGETTGALHLPPHAVFLGEVARSGAAATVSRGRRKHQ